LLVTCHKKVLGATITLGGFTIPCPSDRPGSLLPPSAKAALESFTYEKIVNTA
jgi:hypothetical protein